MIDKKIKVEFPPYLFYNEDVALANAIKGLQNVKQINPELFGPYFCFYVDKTTTEVNINDFLDSLPKEFGFEFSKLLDPSRNQVSSTTVKVQIKNDKYLYYNFSHGQSNIWHSITRDEIVKLIIENVGYQSAQSFRAYRANKNPIEGEKAF